MESLALIDVSGDDDLFLGLASPPALPQPPDRDPPRAGFWVGTEAAAELGPTGSSPSAAGRSADPDGAAEDQAPPERTESPKQRKAKTGVNLRKSLAWDSAFFTSEGVLDTEELAIVNSTFRKTQGSRLPGITEESRRSGESTTSTLESESWAVESIETELFDNVRASIQRSLGKPNKVTARLPASSKPPRATAKTPHVAARNGVDRMPQTKVRAPATTSQGVSGKQKPQVTAKEPTTARVKTLPEDGGAKPSTRPPRALPRVATMRSSTNASISSGIPDKRSSTGGVVNRQAISKSATTSAGGRPGGVMKSNSAPKSGALTAAATKPDARNKTATLSSTKRTAQRIPIRSSSKSDCSKTIPSKSVGNKIPARCSNDCASPTISPSSSIDSMSSVISGASTASTVGRMSHTSESFSSLSASLSPSLRKSNDHPLSTKLRPPNAAEGYSRTAASGDSLIATAGTADRGKSSKPSGLRRPTPKIGYFDADKSIEQVQSTKIQRLLPATPSKLPSAQMTSESLSSFAQQEQKFTAPPEETGASKSRAVKALSVEVTKMDAVPFKETSFVQTVNAQVQLQPTLINCPLPATPNSQHAMSSTQTMIPSSSLISQKDSKSTAVCHDEIISFTSEALMVVPLKVAQMEIELNPVAQMDAIASTNETVKVTEHEACSHESGLILAEHEAELSPVVQMEAIASTNEAVEVTEHEAYSHESGLIVAEHEAELSPVAQMEAIASTNEAVKGTEHEAYSHESGLIVAEHEAELTPVAQMEAIASTNEAVKEKSIDQSIVAHVQGQPIVAEHEAIASTNEAVKKKSIDQSIGAQVQRQPVKIPSTQTMKSGAEPFDETDLNAVTVKVVENEAIVHQNSPLVTTAEASKENIPVLHNDASSLSVDLLIQKLSSVSL